MVGTVLRNRQAIVIPQIQDDVRLEPWRNTVVGLGFISCAALPLICGEQLLGALAIYAPEVDAFDAAELELLTDLADNLAYGICTLRVRAMHEADQRALANSKGRLEVLVQARTAELAAANARLRAEVSERMRVEDAIRQSESRYRTLFEESPVSLWDEDISEVQRYFGQLRHEGVEDLLAYFQAHPEQAYHCLSLVKVVDVKQGDRGHVRGTAQRGYP